MIRIATDGTMEMFASDRKVKNMRKTRIRSAKDVVSKINAWIKKVDEDFIVPGLYLDEEVFQWYIIKGNTEKGKVAHVGTERQLKLQIRKPTFPDGHVLLKSRKHLKVGDKWKGSMGISEAVLADRDYKYDGKVVKISKKNFSKVHKDFKNSTKGKERMLINDPKTGGSISVPVKFEEVELTEKEAAYPSTIENLKKIVKDKQNQIFAFKAGGSIRVDLFSASALVQVYNALKPATKKKFEEMIKTKEGFVKSVDFAFSMAKK